MINELVTALTDLTLAIESLIFGMLIFKRKTSNLRRWLMIFFLSLSLSTFLGSLFHGVFYHTIFDLTIWKLTMFMAGITTISLWMISASIEPSVKITRLIVVFGALEFLIYCVGLTIASSFFWLAIVDYLPAVIFLVFSFIRLYHRTKEYRYALVSADFY